MVSTVFSGHFSDLPSIAIRKLCDLLSTDSLISALSGITIGRTLRLCGATAVRLSTPDSGAMIGPPFDSEYAVDPVGVDIISPSAW